MAANRTAGPRAHALFSEVLRPTAVPVCAAVYFAALALVLCPSYAFWSGDAGVKLVQIQGLIASGGESLALPYPGRRADPQLRHFPIETPYAVRRGNQRYSTFAPMFPAVTTPFYLVFGTAGLYVIPVFGGVACVWLSGRLAANLGLDRRAQAVAAAAVATASPLAFYSATFWEHTPALALLVGALVLLTGECSLCRSLAAGLCMGAAFALRLESAVFLVVAVLGVGLLKLGAHERHRVAAGLALGAAVPIALVCMLNWLWFEHPLGLIGEHFQRGAGGESHSRVVIIARMMWSERAQGYQSALIPLFPACFVGLLALALPGSRKHSPDGAQREVAAARYVAAVSAVYLLAMLFVAPNPGGAQFGPRYLLPAIPGLLVAGVAAAARARRGQLLLCVVFGVLGAYSAARGLEGSYRLWHVKRQIEGPMVDLVRKQRSAAILIGHRFFAQQAASLYASRPMYRLTGESADAELLDRLRAAGVRWALFVSELAPAQTPARFLPSVRRTVRTAPLDAAVPDQLEARHYHFERWDLSGAP
jgi:hypothetical protein